jgi:hypothetical protein
MGRYFLYEILVPEIPQTLYGLSAHTEGPFFVD